MEDLNSRLQGSEERTSDFECGKNYKQNSRCKYMKYMKNLKRNYASCEENWNSITEFQKEN